MEEIKKLFAEIYLYMEESERKHYEESGRPKDHIWRSVKDLAVMLHQEWETTNFDLRITKKQAEHLLRLSSSEKGGTYGMGFDIMCKEYGEDDDWVTVTEDDLSEEGELDEDYQTFELYFTRRN